MKLLINQQFFEPQCHPGTVLLDVLRAQGLKGTKEGCREGDCGACTVLIGHASKNGLCYKSAASCLLPVGDVAGKHIVTIEGLNQDKLSPVQQAIVDEGATQCGFCTPGIVVALTGFLLTTESFALHNAIAAVEGNICRCTGYVSIKRACEKLLAKIDFHKDGNRIETLVAAGLLPKYFVDVAEKLAMIRPEHPDRENSEAMTIAGGTDLFVQKPAILKKQKLQFLSHHPELAEIRQVKSDFFIGSAVTIEALKNHPDFQQSFPEMHKVLKLVSSTLIRNRATVAGNIVNASPIGDLSIMLLALDATLIIKHDRHTRELALDRFFQDYKTFDLRNEEIITAIRIAIPNANSQFHFDKVSKRTYLDIASVNTAMLIAVSNNKIKQARISAGGVAPIPLYLEKTSRYLQGQTVSLETFKKCLDIMDREIAPIDDVRGSALYKRSLLQRLIAAHWLTFAPNLEKDLAHEFS